MICRNGIKKSRLFESVLIILLLLCVSPLFADGKIINLVMSPATPNFGDVVTLDFDYCNDPSDAQGGLLIAFSTFAAAKPSQTVGQVFVVSNAGINSPTIGPVSGTSFSYTMPATTGAACTDCSGSTNKKTHYTMKVNVPNANMFPGCNNTNLYLYVGEKDYYLDGTAWVGLDACHIQKLSWTIGTPPKQFTVHKRAEGVVSNVGDFILYSIDYTYGNGQLTITDPLPANLKIVSVGPLSIASGAGAGATTGTIVWTLPDKTNQPGISSGTVWFLCSLNSALAPGSVLTNTATGSMGGTPADQSTSVSSVVGQITMSVTKTFGPPGGNFNVGDTVTYYLDYEVSGSKLGGYESFDEMPLGASYSNASIPPGWKFQPFNTNTGTWNVMNPCGTGDNYIQANPDGASQYPALLLNSANPHFCTGEIMVDTEIEGSYNGADTQIIVRNNGFAGAANYSIGLILSQDSTPAYVGFQQICCGGGPNYPGVNYPSQLVQLNKWYSVDIKVSQVGNDYLYQAKVWPKGDPIPAAWTATWDQTNGATDPNWRCDGLGNNTDWRPGFNEQGGDGSVQDSFDNFVMLNPFATSAATTLYDSLPAGINYSGYLGAIAPASTGPIVKWNLGPISDETGSYTWWGTVAAGCGLITNTAAMNSAVEPVFSNGVVINVSCGTSTDTPTSTPTLSYTPTMTYTDSPTPPGTFTDTPTITVTLTPTLTPTPMPAIISVMVDPVDYGTAVGGPADFIITVFNSGAQAINMVLSQVIPPNTTFDITSGANTLWSSTVLGPILPAGSVITRQIGTLNSGQSVSYDYLLKTDNTLLSGAVIPVAQPIVNYDDLPPFGPGKSVLGPPATITVGDIVVYPNPFNPKSAVGGVLKFANLPRNCIISIYTESGELVINFLAKASKETWNGKNSSNTMCSAGIYYFIIKDSTAKIITTGKIFMMSGK
jgi:hypothetical protein